MLFLLRKLQSLSFLSRRNNYKNKALYQFFYIFISSTSLNIYTINIYRNYLAVIPINFFSFLIV